MEKIIKFIEAFKKLNFVLKLSIIMALVYLMVSILEQSSSVISAVILHGLAAFILFSTLAIILFLILMALIFMALFASRVRYRFTHQFVRVLVITSIGIGILGGFLFIYWTQQQEYIETLVIRVFLIDAYFMIIGLKLLDDWLSRKSSQEGDEADKRIWNKFHPESKID